MASAKGRSSPFRFNPRAPSFHYRPVSTTTPPSAPTPSTSAPVSARASDTATTGEETQTNNADEHDPWTLARATILSPHTRTHTSRESSISSMNDQPTRQSFRRVHVGVQFPISFLLCFGVAGALIAAKREIRLWELGLGAGAWLASEPVKEVVFGLLTRPAIDEAGNILRGTGTGIPTVVHAVVQEFLRLAAIRVTVALLPDDTLLQAPISTKPGHPGKGRKLPPLDTLFFSALWLALGWAIVEILFGSIDFWNRMKLYDDVLDDDDELVYDEELSLSSSTVIRASQSLYGATSLTERVSRPVVPSGDDKLARNDALEPEAEIIMDAEEEARVEAEADEIVRAIARQEIEGSLGVALWEIPVMVVVVWRVDAILLSLVLTLFLSLPFRTTSPSLVAFPLWPTFIVTTLTHVLLSLLWVLRIPSVGLPSLSYATLVILVGLTFGVLAAWGALE